MAGPGWAGHHTNSARSMAAGSLACFLPPLSLWCGVKSRDLVVDGSSPSYTAGERRQNSSGHLSHSREQGQLRQVQAGESRSGRREGIKTNDFFGGIYYFMSSTAVGALMRAPLDTCSTAADAPLRTEVKFPRIRPENYQESGFFRQTGGRDFRRQYWHVYRRRLEVLAPRVRDACGQSSSDRPILALSELDKVEKGREVILVGTVFKNQVSKPSKFWVSLFQD